MTEQQAILEVLTQYFKSSHSSTDNNVDSIQLRNYLSNIDLPVLSKYQSENMSAHISEQECHAALNTMSDNKSTGLDGFTAEFYKTFWDDLKPFFLECVRFSYEKGQLPNTQKEGIIILHPKPQEDLLLPSNYQLITLLNVDYKIIASTINNRMKSHLNTLIKPGQNGFIKSRHIGDNIRPLSDVIDFADLNDTLGAVLAVDIFKAFDSLKWEFIYQVLEKYGFGSYILHWIKTFYVPPVCRLTNNNFLPDSFAIHKGVRQGDPLSPTLFVLCIECLASALRANSQYVGLQLGSSNVKISLFADDTIIYLDGTVNQFEIVFAIFTKFGMFSGCTINWNKSKAFYIGASKHWQEKPLFHFGLQWPDDTIQYLG